MPVFQVNVVQLIYLYTNTGVSWASSSQITDSSGSGWEILCKLPISCVYR